MPIEVMLCCNDHRNGNFLGYAEAIEVHDVSLVGGRVTVGFKSEKLASAKSYQGEHTLRIGRLVIPCLGYQTWVGNWCWDCATVRGIESWRIINYLAGKPEWYCEKAECSIYEAFNDRCVVTIEEWKRYCGVPDKPPAPASEVHA
jgi:hypothetical protein